MEPTEQVMDSVIDAISVAEMNAQIKQKTTVLSAKEIGRASCRERVLMPV